MSNTHTCKISAVIKLFDNVIHFYIFIHISSQDLKSIACLMLILVQLKKSSMTDQYKAVLLIILYYYHCIYILYQLIVWITIFKCILTKIDLFRYHFPFDWWIRKYKLACKGLGMQNFPLVLFTELSLSIYHLL